MPVVRISESAQTLTLAPGQSLLEGLAEAGVMPPCPCGGHGVCGKCFVRVHGDAGRYTDAELRLLSAAQQTGGFRLACEVYPQGDVTVSLPHAESGTDRVLAHGYLPDYVREPAVTSRAATLPKEDARDSQEAAVAALFGASGLPDALMRRLPALLPADQPLTGLYDENELVDVRVGSAAELFGVAVDIGTTTVVAALLNLQTGEEQGVASAVNPQKQFGFDVLSRISHCMQESDGLAALRASITDCLNELIAEVCAAQGVAVTQVVNICVAANTVMMHLLLGIDPASLGLAPYTPRFTRARNVPASELGIAAAPGARVYCLPCVSAYIGADVVAGVLVAGLHKTAETVLFMDIGTNGELVLAHKGTLYACSCAAGPALEGMNISCGMRAASGAIEDVQWVGDRLEITTIDHTPPRGFCGSGILSAVRAGLRMGLIAPDGKLVRPRQLAEGDPRCAYSAEMDGKPVLQPIPGSALRLTQKDVRQVQLAKGALLSGCLALLQQIGLGVEELDRVLIAGQFGAHLPVSSLLDCGIIPRCPPEKVTYLGNTAKSGACLALLSRPCRREMETLAARIRYLELSTLQDFDRLFVSCVKFSV